MIKDLDNKTLILKNNIEKTSNEYLKLKGKYEVETLSNRQQFERLTEEIELWKGKYMELINNKTLLTEQFEEHYRKEINSLTYENKKVKWEATTKLKEMDMRYKNVCDELKKINGEHTEILNNNSNLVKDYKNTANEAMTNYDNLCNLYTTGFKETIKQVEIV